MSTGGGSYASTVFVPGRILEFLPEINPDRYPEFSRKFTGRDLGIYRKFPGYFIELQTK